MIIDLIIIGLLIVVIIALVVLLLQLNADIKDMEEAFSKFPLFDNKQKTEEELYKEVYRDDVGLLNGTL